MADLPEDGGWVEGVRAIEETDPVRFDIYNESLGALASRTKYLQENMGQGGGGGSAPVEWIDGEGAEVPLTDLSPDTMYILDVRSGNWLGIVIPENHTSVPVGAEYHFVCAGDPEITRIYEYTPAPEGFVIKTTDGVVAEIEGPGEVQGTGIYVSADGSIEGQSQLEEVLAWPEEKPLWLEGNGFVFSDAQYLTKVPDTLPAWITDTYNMFSGCSIFNQDLSGWDTSNVTDMWDMFRDCSSFNQDLSGWDTSSVTYMYAMFSGCSSFNQDLSGWDVSRVTDMGNMFNRCSNFNQGLSGWDVSSVTDMTSMFNGCSSFDQDLSGWDTSSVTNMSSMFNGCSSFNQDISGWDTSNVVDMPSMFEQCSSFNQDLSGWDTSSVTDMFSMFYGCSNFNQDLSGWCVSNFSSEPDYFSTYTDSWTLPKPIWGTCP